MFANIDPLFKTLFRHAEKSDTRQSLARKDPVQERKKPKDGENTDKNGPLHDDETDVSLEALTSFLQTLLGTKNHIFNNNAEQIESPAPKTTQDTKSSYAINAYQKTAGKQKKTINITENEPAEMDPDLILEEKDRETVERLLNDLNALKQKNIQYLVISRQGTFFESVKDAIELAHDTFNL